MSPDIIFTATTAVPPIQKNYDLNTLNHIVYYLSLIRTIFDVQLIGFK